MERYEAILEQLKKAQSRGMETFTNRLDFVVQSLEELIQEAKSSVQGALPQSADECLPVNEVEAALAAFRDEVAAADERADSLAATVADLETSLESGRQGMSIELMRALDSARSQSELLRELLPVLAENAARAVVLVLRDESVSAWSGIGFTDGERLRAWLGDVDKSPVIGRLLETAAPVRCTAADDALIASWLADDDQPEEILLVPVFLRGKMMGAMYLDRFDGRPWNPGVAQSLIALVCWLIDTLQYRPGPAPMLAAPVEVRVPEPTVFGGAPEEISPDDEEPPGWTEDVEPEIPAPVEDPSATVRIDVSDAVAAPVEAEPVDEGVGDIVIDEPEVGVEDVPETQFEPEPEATMPPEVEAGPEIEFEPEAPVEFDSSFEPPEAEVAPVEVSEIPLEVQMPVMPVDEPEPEPEPEEGETGFLDEPPPVKPVQPPPARAETEVAVEEARQEEARRFARLLVSEIKLYNEEQVERGREAKDIYRRLKEDIDRSQEMFDKRIAAEVRADKNYFHVELVRILADGDPEALGM